MTTTYTRRGALIGFILGVLALAALYALATTCVSYFVTYPDATWPWYCVPSTYAKLVYLGFPMNVLSGDLAEAPYYAPLTLILYTLFGALIGRFAARFSRHEG